MTPLEIKDYTARLERAAMTLMRMSVFRKPDDLARRYSLPLPVVRYWWRHTDEKRESCDPIKPTPAEVKRIRRAGQALESWEKTKRNRPVCGVPLSSGKKCKTVVAIRPPEGWEMGCLATRCRMHGGLARRLIKPRKASISAEDER